MTHRSVRASASTARRFTPPLAVGAAVAAATGLLGLGLSAPAFAAENTVDDAVFQWSVNDESTGGSYFGGCNFLTAGVAGDATMARIWTANDSGTLYKVDGSGKFVDENTSIVKTNGELSTFDDRCKTGEGTVVNGKVNAEAADNHTGDHVEIKNGTGTIDPDADNASIQWEGSWSFAYYGGMTYWTISDPKLEVKDGKGTITGTYSGYGADMDDLSVWKKLDPREGDVVEIQNGSVDVTEDGFEFTPDYLGVETTTDGRNLQAPKSAENESWWGAMPQDWIDFNIETGQDSYWYTTAGAATSIQPRKKTNPVTVEYTAQAPAPDVSTSHSVKSVDAEEGLTVNVKGEGYDNLPNSSLGTPAAGAYAAVVDRELASDDINAGNTAGVQYVRPTQITDGKIDVDVLAETADLDEAKDYDLVTWVAHGLAQGDALLYRAPIELSHEQKEALFPSEDTDEAEADSDTGAEGDEANSETDTEGAADGAESDEDGSADGAEADDKGAADGAKGDEDGAEAEAETDSEGTADGAEADDKGTADGAEADDKGAADGAEAEAETDSEGTADGAEADDKGTADGAEADSKGSADGSDSDGSDDGGVETPAKPEIGDQTVGENGEITGKAAPNAEVTLAWTPDTAENQAAQTQVKTQATASEDEVPSEGTVTVTADAEGYFTAKAPSAAGTYAYTAAATVEGVPSDTAEFTVTVNAAADDDAAAGSAAGGAEGSTDGTGADAAGSADGTADAAEGSADGSNAGAGSGTEGSSSADSGFEGSAGGSNLPRTGTELVTLPIAAGLIVLGAASVMFSRMRKR
ncbi:LPXTG cell wall anchor domain-containing protein [Brevibacterium aurantiacum]|uniref:LPXTG cell wall anchor domain-containing protein n=1 Tax=Brevibacterium aurantiacum TaxID=273384 RepID=A0A556CAU1_BREAU|nr:HtaA domain-containing protein [Brevibacterium aurantiacum]TSI14564.1 LPXTG cell wall anchor domain-containing protein [Brevibacterium aurantiacum]